jgi:hypothetical protein
MSVMDCVPMLIPLISSILAINFFSMLSSIIPLPGGIGQPFLTILIMYIVTYLYAKIFKCWKSDKYIIVRAIVPVLIFVAWLLAFVFPVTSPFMFAFGNSPFLIAALSIVYKLAYDKIFESC